MADTEDQDPQLLAARELLERLIRSAGFKLYEVDATVGFNRGWVGRVLHGDIRLGYQHILKILEAIEVDPHVFFTTLHPARWRRFVPPPVPGDLYEDTRALAERVLSKLPAAKDEPPRPALSKEDLEERIDTAVRAVLAHRRGPRPPTRK